MLCECLRLEGFKDPWDFTIYRGRTLDPKATLESLGLTSDATLISVRRVLISEGDTPPLLHLCGSTSKTFEVRILDSS